MRVSGCAGPNGKQRKQQGERLGKGHESNQNSRGHCFKKSEKMACQRIRSYTILDYLYRLRIGANYEDSSTFIEGPTSKDDAFLFHKRLTYLTSATALVSEYRIAALVGTARFNKWADDFISTGMPSGLSLGIKDRRQFF